MYKYDDWPGTRQLCLVRPTINMKPVVGLFLVSFVWMNVAAYPFFEHEYERTALGDAIDKASLKTLHEAYTSSQDKNVITSPLGIQLILSLYSNGAGPQSQQEINSYLGGGELKKLTDSYSGLSREFASLDPNYLTLANKIYVAQHYELNEEFNNVARSSYRSEVESLNFGNPAEAAAVINKWADEKTKGHIKDPVSSDALTPDTAAALFNVIFFQGHWHVPFDANQTKDEDFHVDKQTTVKKPTMKLLQSLFYTESETLGAKMIELPYKEPGFRMVVVLPNEIDGLPSVLEKASKAGVLEDVFKLSPAGQDIDLAMPKFEVKNKLDLNDLLPKMGISKLFEEPASGIVKGTTVKVSKAFQEAFVKVDEEGATAGAFTGLVAVTYISNATPPPPLKLSVDHPFLYLILHQEKILFAGTYSH